MLRTAVYLNILNAHHCQLMPQARNGINDKLLAFGALLIKLFGNFFIDIGMQKAEGQILQFPFQFPYPQAVGQRRIERQRLARYLHAQRIGRCCIVAQRLRAGSQPQQNNADILDHRQQHLAQHLDLRLQFSRVLRAVFLRMGNEPMGNRPQTMQLGNAADELGDGGAETLADLLQPLRLVRRHGK